VVQTSAVKICETINRRRVETSLCLEDLAEGSRVSVSFHVPAGWLKQELVPQSVADRPLDWYEQTSAVREFMEKQGGNK